MGLQNYITAEQARTIDLAMPANQNLQIGTQIKAILDQAGTIGNVYYVDPANGSDSNDGKSRSTAFKSIPAGYAAMTANQHDVLFYVAGSSSTYLSAKLTWAKNYCHFIGIAAPTVAGQRARIMQLSTATGLSPMIEITASGCIFKNLYIMQGVNDATSKINVQVTGGRNYFENVHFAGVGNITQDVAGACSLALNGSEENTFNNCTFGLDTTVGQVNSSNVIFLAGTANHRNFFIECRFTADIGATTYNHVLLADGTAMDRWNIFKYCMFISDSTNRAFAQASVFKSQAGAVQGKIILFDCMAITDGTPAWDSASNGCIWANMAAAAATAGGGIATKK